MTGARTRWTALAAAALLALGAQGALAAGGSGGGGGASGGGGGGATGGGSGGVTGGGSGGATGGGGGKACSVFASTAVDASYSPGLALKATWTLAACARRPRVTMTATNLTTGIREFTNSLDASAGTISYGWPQFATAYQVEVYVTSATDTIVQGSVTTTVTTPAAILGCASFTQFAPSAGYFSIWSAIWVPWSATGCLSGADTVTIRVTNLTSGRKELEYTSYQMQGLYDYEGVFVSYDTDYRIDVEAHDMGGILTDSRSSIVHTPVLR